jgi:hypothetical protein
MGPGHFWPIGILRAHIYAVSSNPALHRQGFQPYRHQAREQYQLRMVQTEGAGWAWTTAIHGHGINNGSERSSIARMPISMNDLPGLTQGSAGRFAMHCLFGPLMPVTSFHPYVCSYRPTSCLLSPYRHRRCSPYDLCQKWLWRRRASSCLCPRSG